MRTKLIAILLCMAMMVSFTVGLASCGDGNEENSSDTSQTTNTTEADTGNTTETDDSNTEVTDESDDTETDSDNTETQDTGSSESDSNSTDQTEDTETETGEVITTPIIYGNGDKITGAGDDLKSDAFALTAPKFNAAIATDITAGELLALIASGNTGNKVYNVTDTLVLPSGTYDAKKATIIATQGVVVKDATAVTLKNAVIVGSLTIENSSALTIANVAIQGDDTAIIVDADSFNVMFNFCRATATNIAVKTDGNDVSFYQSYISADKAIVSSGDGMVVQSSRIAAVGCAITSSGSDCIFRSNTIAVGNEGVGVELTKGSVNGLVALNVITDAQASVRVSEGYNCAVIMNSAIKVIAENTTNIYIVDNKLGGRIEATDNNYFICDGNKTVVDGKNHAIVAKNNNNVNGDNVTDVNSRSEVGVNEDILPHTNKELFIDMERKTIVRDASVSKNRQKALGDYIADKAKQGSVVIVPPGAYSCGSIALGTTNSDCTIYAYGVYQESTGYGTNISISQSSNLEIKGLTTGYSDISAGQAYVLKKWSNGNVLLVSGAGWPEDFGRSNPQVFSTGYNDVFAMGELHNYGAVGSAYNFISKNEDGTMLMNLTDRADILALTNGDIFSCRMAGNNSHSVSLTSAKGIVFTDLVIYGYTAAVAVRTYESEGVEFLRFHNTVKAAPVIDKETYDKYVALEEKYGVDLEVYIDEQGRYRGSTPRQGSVDATHIQNNVDGITVVSSIFESMCDDGSNHRASSSRLAGLKDNGDGTTTITYKGSLAQVYYNLNLGKVGTSASHCSPFSAGDRVLIYTSTGKVVCDADVLYDGVLINTKTATIVAGEINSSDKNHQFTVRYYEIVVPTSSVNFDAIEGFDLTDDHYRMDNKILVDNLSKNSAELKFDNVLIQNFRSRGILAKTTGAEIKNCTFRNLAMTGVLLSTETTWGESSVSRDIVIKNCLFDHTGHNNKKSTTYAPVALVGFGEEGKLLDSYIYKNITIDGNVFINSENIYGITVHNGQDITIKNNTFYYSLSEDETTAGVSIELNGVINVEISGNKYCDANGATVDLPIDRIQVQYNKNVHDGKGNALFSDGIVPETKE